MCINEHAVLVYENHPIYSTDLNKNFQLHRAETGNFIIIRDMFRFLLELTYFSLKTSVK